jgi:cytochrome c oxidase cbb3-type subunit II
MAKSPIERFSTVFFVAGIVFFAFSFVSSGLVPWLMMKKIPTKTMDDLAKDIPKGFYSLAKEYPEEFKLHYGDANATSFKEALELGRDIYIGEGCWHCHSQQVRPVSNEGLRFGKVSYASEYNNVLQMPQMMGTRRVGPDLIREAGLRTNDWHMAHFYKPTDVAPLSVMPEFPWFFTKDKRPNKKGLAIVTYMQWLGSWVKDSTDEIMKSIPSANRATAVK